MTVIIRRATYRDVPALAGIERAAGMLFLDIGMPEIAHDDPLPDDVLQAAVDIGLLWVAAGCHAASGGWMIAPKMAKAKPRILLAGWIRGFTLEGENGREAVSGLGLSLSVVAWVGKVPSGTGWRRSRRPLSM